MPSNSFCPYHNSNGVTKVFIFQETDTTRVLVCFPGYDFIPSFFRQKRKANIFVLITLLTWKEPRQTERFLLPLYQNSSFY